MRCGVSWGKSPLNASYGMRLITITPQVLAYHFGPRKDKAFKALKEKLNQFDIDLYYTGDWGAYLKYYRNRNLIGKRYTQAIEIKHLTLSTRIKRLASSRNHMTLSSDYLLTDMSLVKALFFNKRSQECRLNVIFLFIPIPTSSCRQK